MKEIKFTRYTKEFRNSPPYYQIYNFEYNLNSLEDLSALCKIICVEVAYIRVC
jgi:hypothetical protein